MKSSVPRLFLAILALSITVLLSACVSRNSECTHRYDQWTIERPVTCTSNGLQTRTCEKCGYTDSKVTEALGHVEVADAAIAATCTTDGKTEGKHCSACGDVVVAQTVVAALGHEEVIDEAIEATCTSTGLTEGRHCAVCGMTIVAQSKTNLVAHSYGEGVIVVPASCISEGTMEYVCSVCGEEHTESYALPTITATDLYTQSIEYVGEITVYDKNGDAFATGTGFVTTADGTIVTNYHVIEGAYYADIALNGNVYDIDTVLAFDATIDLAVVKIDASDLTVATVCKNPVKVGETVYTLGSSRGLTNTYAQGIITYAERVIDGVTYVQHDAAMSPGNSGGPLINSYGEVIGINTFLVRDAQNLNFSVFVSELDNLEYGAPLTLIDLFGNESNTFETLKNAIINSGDYDSNDECYIVELGSDMDDTYTYYRDTYYYPNVDTATLDLIIYEGNEFRYWTYIELPADLSGVYVWRFFDYKDCQLEGTIDAAAFGYDDILVIDAYENITTQEQYDSLHELANITMRLLCSYITEDLAPIEITAEDLGFVMY